MAERAGFTKRGKDVIISARMAQEGAEKIDWPKFSRANILTREQYEALRDFASAHDIRISGFRKFDGDVSLIREAITDLDALQRRHPGVTDARHKLTLAVSYNMDANDFAKTRGRVITLNGDAYRNRERLKAEYQKSVSDGWFVEGTDYRAIIHHEFGHVVGKVFRLNPLKIACRITGKDSAYTIGYVLDVLSEYAGSDAEDGLEIISEVFADLSTAHPSDFSRRFYEEYKRAVRKE